MSLFLISYFPIFIFSITLRNRPEISLSLQSSKIEMFIDVEDGSIHSHSRCYKIVSLQKERASTMYTCEAKAKNLFCH